MTTDEQRLRGRLFDEDPELYARVRPTYPYELFADLVTITGLNDRSSVLEVGAGTGQATASLAAIAGRVTAIEPGPALVDLVRTHVAGLRNVEIERSTLEDWDDRGRRYDAVVAASSWHWVDPDLAWRLAYNVLHPGGWLALMGHVVVRRPGELEVYAETADLHERFVPGNPDWGHPPFEADVLATNRGWGPPNEDRDGLFGETVVRWYPAVQWLDGAEFADQLRSTSTYRSLDPDVRERLLDAIAKRIRTRLDDRAPRRYLTVLRAGQRVGPT